MNKHRVAVFYHSKCPRMLGTMCQIPATRFLEHSRENFDKTTPFKNIASMLNRADARKRSGESVRWMSFAASFHDSRTNYVDGHRRPNT